MKHFLRDDDLDHATQAGVLRAALALKAARAARRPGPKPLADPVLGQRPVALVFDKPSTRTRLSFATGVLELGGFPLVLDAATRGEPVADTARVLGRQVAAIAWRTGAQEGLEVMAAHAGVPVVNALSDLLHPCQVLADLLTVAERRGGVDTLPGTVLAYVGDGANNMANSYLLGGAVAGLHVRVGTPGMLQPDPGVLDAARAAAAATGGSVEVCSSARAAVEGAHVVATDTWVSMGDEAGAEQRVAALRPYALTTDLMTGAEPGAGVLHCLPAYRDLEIDAVLLDGEGAWAWDEAENRLHAQKALLVHLLERA